MLPLFRTLGLRYLRLHLDRSLLIVLSIALGVATLVSTQILLQCLEVAASQTTTPMKGAADLYVTNGEVGVQASLLAPIRSAEGVGTAQPLVFERVTLPDLASRPAVFFGVDLLDLEELRDVESKYRIHVTWTFSGLLKRFDLPLVVISRELAELRQHSGVAADAPVTARVAGKSVEMLPVGVVDMDREGPAAKLGRYLIATDIATASRVTGRPERVSRIDVFFAPGADPGAAAAAVRAAVGDRAQVRTPEAQGASTEQVIGGIKAGFAICAAGAMVVGLFLVYNALSVSVTERRHDIGVMRSLGATRFQVARVFATEAVFLGLAGALLGLPMGTGLAVLALEMVEEELKSVFLSGDLSPVLLDWDLLAAAVAAGVATALGAALLPAVRAASDEPADAVRRAPDGPGGVYRRLHGLLCLTLVGSGVALILFRGALPPRFGSYFGLVLVLVGLLAAMPFLVGAFAELLRPVVRWLFGIEMRLAAENLTRSPGRTGLVIGAFGAGVALMFQIAGVGRSNEEPVMDWLDRVVKADLFLFAEGLASANSSGSPMQPEVGLELTRRVSGVERAVGIRFARVEYGSTVVYMVAIDAVNYARATARRAAEAAPELQHFFELTAPNTALISDNFAVKHDVRPGDTITLPGPKGPVRLRVAAAVPDYTWSQGTIFLDRAEYARLFEDRLVDIYHLFLRDTPGGGGEAARGAVEEFAAERALMVADLPTVRGYIAGLINRIYQLAYLQQVVVAVVASLGIIMAVLISVLQRRRELGLLRAVGATRAQVLRSVLCEAVLMGLLGTVLGILIGLPLEWYILRVVLYEESGFVFDVLIPWEQALGIAGGAMLVASLAGLLPALHAVRLRIPEAIAYE